MAAISLAGALVAGVGCTGATTAPTRAVREPAISRTDLDAVAARYRTACRSPGATVGVRTRRGTEHFGFAGELAPGVAIGRDSQFLAGSVTKLFVATVAHQLIEAHRLSLDATVDRYLPDWPNGDRITVRMLLGHRSGMGDFGNDFSAQLRDLVLANPARSFRYDEVLDLVRQVAPVAAPGTTYHYSNANSIVLGAILQDVTHRTLGQLMEARVIEPLRLRDTLYGPDALDAANAIAFHGLFDVAGTGQPVDIGTFPRDAALTVDPAGAGIFSSVPDLLTLTRALFATDRLLTPKSRRDLARSVSTLDARDLLLGRRYAIDGHGGASPGAQTMVAFDAVSGTTVAVWCNRLDPGPNELLPSVVATRDAFRLATR